MKTLPKKIALTAVLTLTANLWGCAMPAMQSGDNQQQNRARKGPPPEAIQACANLNENDACHFSSPRGEASGMCVIPSQQNSQPACLPEGMKKPQN